MATAFSVQNRPDTLHARREIVERVILAMRSRLFEHLSLQDMADVACLSPFHFNRIFHQTTGITPTQFLYAIRLEQAKRLLLTTALTVTEIGYEVGYNSLGTFIFRFTQLVGVSPARLRLLASSMPIPAFEKMLPADRMADANQPFADGRINCPSSFSGVFFVGLFDSRIPQKRPVGGTVMTRPGPYRLAGCPDGQYHVLAAGLPFSLDPLAYWLPDTSSLLVGAGHKTLLVRDQNPLRSVDVTLRPTTVLDPPILVALPALLAGNSNAGDLDKRDARL